MATRPQRPRATKIYSDLATLRTRESNRTLESKHQSPSHTAARSVENDFKRPVKSGTSITSNKTDTRSIKTDPVTTLPVEGNGTELVNGTFTSSLKPINRLNSLPTPTSKRTTYSNVSKKEEGETGAEVQNSKSSASSSAYSKHGYGKETRKLAAQGDLKIKHDEQLQANGIKSIGNAVSKVGRAAKNIKDKDRSVHGTAYEPKVIKASGRNPVNQKSHVNKSLKVMILNMKGRDDRNGAIAERRRHIFHNVIQKHLPGLVLVQDFKLPSITTKFWSKSPLPSQYAYIGTEDTGIMFDETVIDIQDVPIAEFRNTMDGLHRHANNKLKRIVPIEFDPFPRMCSRLVTMKHGASVHFICISWRGDFSPNSTKLKHSQKLEYFEYLMEFLRIVKEKLKLPIVIGGNFYVDLYSIEHLVQSPFQLCIYDASMRRTVPGIIDYFIITEDLVLTDTTWVSLREDTTAYQPTGVMDHDPVKAVLFGKPGKGNGPKRMINPNKWSSPKI